MTKNAFVVLLLLILPACLSMRQENSRLPEGVVEADGVIHYVELEGGFYGITTDRGARFYPTNLDDEYMRDGLRIRFRGAVQEDVVSIHMWGTPVELEWIEQL